MATTGASASVRISDPVVIVVVVFLLIWIFAPWILRKIIPGWPDFGWPFGGGGGDDDDDTGGIWDNVQGGSSTYPAGTQGGAGSCWRPEVVCAGFRLGVLRSYTGLPCSTVQCRNGYLYDTNAQGGNRGLDRVHREGSFVGWQRIP